MITTVTYKDSNTGEIFQAPFMTSDDTTGSLDCVWLIRTVQAYENLELVSVEGPGLDYFKNYCAYMTAMGRPISF